ncbi:uncharacterized protein STEHIDRAFT_152583 [Stereum hirsutum FP-91666 SS1]|uniref:uncharacterized protein n=1 Tax=Stereum hirsutum (strain FP-91666) TaxID=721885 RepID=UPI000440F22C|nr:uncharacterized protein STEHIDRAFT_152583 [Stereum hirsutum FP-91666 SS1]EIM90892.1 hypothetical protein STEHIDRAFT_152583 [Stereum hirsutum FP-91666 SS1]
MADDLPWPDIGNVARGATRGNQGQKGVLSPPDNEGRCSLQLRVQPGVLTVLLNRQASDWYRRLDHEVNHALKLTKTYWRKARRRQDYDATADQDHMELHEWLQQLKDKVMSHLELLMQRGDIKGPPYIMPDDVELTFLRKFIERQAAGIPHNPRLRHTAVSKRYAPHVRHSLPDSETPEPSDDSMTNGSDGGWDDTNPPYISNETSAPHYTQHPVQAVAYANHVKAVSPRIVSTYEEELDTSRRLLQHARTTLRQAQKDTQDAFAVYTASIEAERRAWQAVAAEEDRRDGLVTVILRQKPQFDPYPRKESFSSDSELPRYSQYLPRPHHVNSAGRPRTADHSAPMRPAYAWDTERYEHAESASRTTSPQSTNSSPRVPERVATHNSPPERKHARHWDDEDQSVSGLPPRKRSNHGSADGSPKITA